MLPEGHLGPDKQKAVEPMILHLTAIFSGKESLVRFLS